ncbi:MAG: hypothetical protein CL910_08880 [Deltaproteobacteria bacterium]|jgi:predicted RNA-binding protein Jag|nr:hypothetical protein [Deltaproteobacteria bacterium]
MYDTKAEAHEFLGDTSEEAIGKALTYFGVGREELTIKEYNEIGVSGLGGRALIVAQPTAAIGTIATGGGDRDRGGRGGRDRDRGDRGGRGRDRDRDRDRGGRGGRDRDRDRGRGRDRDRAPRDSEEAVAAPAEDLGPSKGEATGEVGPIGDFILGVIERMELGPFTLAKEAEEEKFIVFKVDGVAANGLTAGDGRTPDALQLLANQAAGQGDDEPKRIIVDVDGNRGRRDDFLERVAERAAKRADDTGRTVALEPMSPRDRRIIHVSLREMDGVETMSRGEGRYRQVLVVPEGAAEYEEAQKAAASAPADDD